MLERIRNGRINGLFEEGRVTRLRDRVERLIEIVAFFPNKDSLEGNGAVQPETQFDIPDEEFVDIDDIFHPEMQLEFPEEGPLEIEKGPKSGFYVRISPVIYGEMRKRDTFFKGLKYELLNILEEIEFIGDNNNVSTETEGDKTQYEAFWVISKISYSRISRKLVVCCEPIDSPMPIVTTQE